MYPTYKRKYLKDMYVYNVYTYISQRHVCIQRINVNISKTCMYTTYKRKYLKDMYVYNV